MPRTATKTRTRSATTTKTAILIGAGLAIAAGLGYVGMQSPLGQSLQSGLLRMAANSPVPPGYMPPGYVPPGYTGLHPGTTVTCAGGGWQIGKKTTLARLSKSSVIRQTSSSTLYWYAVDGKRYVFPNVKTYRTWFPGACPTISEITDADMARITIGGNITYRPDSRFIKTTTDPKVYAPSKGGVIHRIPTEAMAKQIAGAHWNTRVDDVPDAFFVNYTIGAALTSSSTYQTVTQYRDITIDQHLGLVPTVIFKTSPTLSKLAVSSATLSSTANMELFKFQITPGAGGPVSWKQIAFNIQPSAGLTLGQFQFYKGTTRMPSSAVKIVAGSNVDVTTKKLPAGKAATVYVQLTNEDVVSGSGTSYTLRATPTFTGTGKSVSTKLATANGVAAMGYITQTVGRGAMGIDTNASQPDRVSDVISTFTWSDRSAVPHSDALTGSSRDWFNETPIVGLNGAVFTQTQVLSN